MISKAERDALINAALRSRVEGHYGEARARLEEALRRDPTSADAHRYLGQTLSYQAADEAPDAEAKEAALAEAEKWIRRAENLQGGESPDTLHDVAWIEDERGRYENAIALYIRARDQARREGRSENAGYTYNLACTLVKAGELERALDELETVLGETWQWAEKDPDFEPLRRSAQTRARFEQRIREAKAGGRK